MCYFFYSYLMTCSKARLKVIGVSHVCTLIFSCIEDMLVHSKCWFLSSYVFDTVSSVGLTLSRSRASLRALQLQEEPHHQPPKKTLAKTD